MTHIFRFLGKKLQDDLWELSEADLDHALKTLRFKAGFSLEVTDGQGLWCKGMLVEWQAKLVVKVIEEFHEKLPQHRLDLAVGALKFRVLDEVLPALVELGVDGIHVFKQKGVEADRLNGKIEARWLKILGEASKQAKRAFIPRLKIQESLESLINSSSDFTTRLYADPLATGVINTQPLDGGAVICVLGAEHGLTDTETKVLLSSGFSPVRLGPFVLRSTTALVAAAAILAVRRL